LNASLRNPNKRLTYSLSTNDEPLSLGAILGGLKLNRNVSLI